jgi:hypothetical protein
MRHYVSLPIKYLFCLGVAILVVALITFFTVQEIRQTNRLKANRDRTKAAISQVREENRELLKEIESLHTLEGLEKEARALGLMRKDELAYIFEK